MWPFEKKEKPLDPQTKDEFHRKAQELAPDLLRFGNDAGKNLFGVLRGREARVEEAEKELLVAVDTLSFCTHLVDRYASRTLGRQLGKVFVGDLRQEMCRLLGSVQPRAKRCALKIMPALSKGAGRRQAPHTVSLNADPSEGQRQPGRRAFLGIHQQGGRDLRKCQQRTAQAGIACGSGHRRNDPANHKGNPPRGEAVGAIRPRSKEDTKPIFRR